MNSRRLICLGLVLIPLTLGGCTSMGVEPWERDLLAKESMALDDPIDTALDEHIYFSREASTGGIGFGGGGCGCN